MNKLKFTKTKITLAILLIVIVVTYISCGNFMKIVQLRINQKLESKAFYATIPFEYRHGWIIIEADINGKGKRKFILDNGTGVSMIFKNHLTEFELSKTKVFQETAFVTGEKTKKYFYGPTMLDIGGVKFSNISVTEGDNPALPCDEDLCGIIGAIPLLKCCVQVDYKSKTLILTDDPSKFAPTTLTNKMTFKDEGKLTVKSKIGETPCSIIIDLGNSGVLAIPDEIYSKIRKDNNIKLIQKGKGFPANYNEKNNKDETEYVNIQKLNLGEIAFTNIKAHNYKQAPLMLLGSDFLQNYIVTIDMKNSLLYLKENPLNANRTLNGFGFRLGWKDNNMYISYLNEKLFSTLSVGDKVISINNVLVGNQEFCAYTSPNLDEIKANTIINLKAEHDGKIVELKLENIY